jgi:hypothetical protein
VSSYCAKVERMRSNASLDESSKISGDEHSNLVLCKNKILHERRGDCPERPEIIN